MHKLMSKLEKFLLGLRSSNHLPSPAIFTSFPSDEPKPAALNHCVALLRCCTSFPAVKQIHAFSIRRFVPISHPTLAKHLIVSLSSRMSYPSLLFPPPRRLHLQHPGPRRRCLLPHDPRRPPARHPHLPFPPQGRRQDHGPLPGRPSGQDGVLGIDHLFKGQNRQSLKSGRRSKQMAASRQRKRSRVPLPSPDSATATSGSHANASRHYPAARAARLMPTPPATCSYEKGLQCRCAAGREGRCRLGWRSGVSGVWWAGAGRAGKAARDGWDILFSRWIGSNGCAAAHRY